MGTMSQSATEVTLLVNGEQVKVRVLERRRESVCFELEGRRFSVSLEEALPELAQAASGKRRSQRAHSGVLGAVPSPIPGLVIDVPVETGQKVEAGEIVCRIEAMKMENNIFAPASGIVEAIFVEKGDEVNTGQELLSIGSAGKSD